MAWPDLDPPRLAERPLSLQEALFVLEAPPEALPALAEAAIRVKEYFFGRRLKLVRLLNVKSGFCPEDCAYCAQSARSQAAIARYPLLSLEEILERAEEAQRLSARRFCLVAALRGPTPKVLERLGEAAQAIKARFPLELCASLGLLEEGMAEALKAAGFDYYNHNLNTAPSLYPRIATTHTYQDRSWTLKRAREAGLKLCSGVILGMGEGPKEVYEMALALRELGVESLPVNFLLPIPGTPLGDGRTVAGLTPERALKALILFRLLNPKAELRASAGRERYLGPYEPLAFRMVNSIFLQGYLTQPGSPWERDRALWESLGLDVEEGACG